MKIAFFTDTYYPNISGVLENIETSAKALRELGHEVIIVAPRTSGQRIEDKNVIWLPSIKIKRNPELRLMIPYPDSAVRELMGKGFDLIHAHAGGPICFLGWEIARRKKIPYVFTYHTLFNRYTHYILNGKVVTPRMTEIGSRLFCNMCTRVIVPTKMVRRELRRYGVKKKVEVIAGGIQLSKFSDQQKGFLREKFGIGKDEIVILYVGRLGKEKNIDFIIKSFAAIEDKTKLKLVIVGDGPEKSKLMELAKELEVGRQTIFTGFVPREDIGRVYTDGDIFAFASKTETQGLVIPEAMAASLPVLVVEDGAFKEVVINGRTGLVAKPTQESFTNKLELLIEDQELRQRLGSAGKKLVGQKYSSQLQAEKLVAVYKRALNIKQSSLRDRGVLRKSLYSLADYFKITQSFNQFKSMIRFDNDFYS